MRTLRMSRLYRPTYQFNSFFKERESTILMRVLSNAFSSTNAVNVNCSNSSSFGN